MRIPLHLIAVCLFLGRALVAADQTDVLIYGATPGGIAAAVAAAKGGHEVLLVEPTSRLGGLLTCGLSYSDFRSFEALTGFFLDFSQRVEADYRRRYGDESPQARECWRGTYGEPSVNLRILEAMLAEHPRIRVLKQHRLTAVTTSPFQLGRRRLLSARFTLSDGSSASFAAAIYIDGSYEGDLMAMAGENYHVGRESRAQYGEPLAGDENGQADGQVQGYNFRLCMTQVAGNKLAPVAPVNYRREDFTGVLALIQSGKLTKVFDGGHKGIFRAHQPLMPNGKADVNDAPGAPARLSMPDINDAWPEADAATRQRLFDEHQYYHVGLLYFLQNDPEVPQAVRAEASSWGWCKDEFTETGGLPPQLYVREGRRLVGQHVFTGNDTVTAPRDARAVLHTDSIASADYIHNCHGTGRKGTRFDGEHVGQFFAFVQPYQIAYGVIVPVKTENLLVPVACSASHFGFGALRLEPVWTSLGQAAGWAAHLALTAKTTVQAVDVAALQQQLHQDRSATVYVTDVPPASPDFAAAQWWGTRGGFHGLVDIDQPAKPKNIIGQYCEPFAHHEAGLDLPLTPELRAKWEKLLPQNRAAPSNARTRGDWIREAYGLAAKTAK
jgi:hypothetical protein